WRAAVCERPRRFTMETTAIDMPLFSRVKMRITYEFRSVAGRTHLDRTWTYDLPSRALQLLDRLHLRRNLIAESDRALSRLKRLADAAALSARAAPRPNDEGHARTAP